MSKQAPDYGLDAGAAVRAMFIVGLAAAIGGFLILRGRLLLAEHVLLQTHGPFEGRGRAIRPYSLQIWIAPRRA